MTRLYDAEGEELFECDTCHEYVTAEFMSAGEANECDECGHKRMLEARSAYRRDRAFAARESMAERLRNQADDARLAAKERFT